jgi:DNA-directed RNA polymerase specialized sigma24 family protein
MKFLSQKWLEKRKAPVALTAFVLERPTFSIVDLLNAMVSQGHLDWVHWIINKQNRIRDNDVEYRKQYDNETNSSPYWDDFSRVRKYEESEHPRANPDMLGEDAAFWPNREPINDAEAMLEAIKQAYMQASIPECRAFDMIGSRGYTYRKAAQALRTTESNVHEAFTRFKNKAQKLYEELKRKHPNKEAK